MDGAHLDQTNREEPPADRTRHVGAHQRRGEAINTSPVDRHLPADRQVREHLISQAAATFAAEHDHIQNHWISIQLSVARERWRRLQGYSLPADYLERQSLTSARVLALCASMVSQ
ncbi:hypothetical protein [Aquabacterium sp.]|uniref:hypothetical protein n=1 Tax=Aquabacterium sp. TaxID=1872578 RepID=UPI00378324CB